MSCQLRTFCYALCPALHWASWPQAACIPLRATSMFKRKPKQPKSIPTPESSPPSTPREQEEPQVPTFTEIGGSPVPGLTLRQVLRGHTDWIGRIAWSPDGTYLASPSEDSTIWIWDARSGACVRTPRGILMEFGVRRGRPIVSASSRLRLITLSACGRSPAASICKRWKGILVGFIAWRGRRMVSASPRLPLMGPSACGKPPAARHCKY
jgi:hypothetical protein